MKTNYLKIIFFLLFMNNIALAQNYIKPFEDRINFSILSETVLLTDSETYVKCEKSNSKNLFYYFDSKTNKKIISEGFEMAYPFVGKTAIVKQKKHWKLIDKKGKIVYDSKSETAPFFSSYEKYVLFNNDKFIYDLKLGRQEKGYIYCAEPASPDYYIKTLNNGKFSFIKIKNNKEENVFQMEFDSISQQQFLMYENNDNLLILKKNNKFGIAYANGTYLTEIKYKNAAFIGNYIMVFENNKWNYYLYENQKLKLITSSDYECKYDVYQSNVIGVFEKNKKFNILKKDGQILNLYFDYISWNGTFGVSGESVYILNSDGNYQLYFTK